jgi:hypothetical protein
MTVVLACVSATLPKVEVAFPVAVKTDAELVPVSVNVFVVLFQTKALLAVK